MSDRPQYSDHLDVLLALITYLALTRWRSRSPNGLARDLGLDEAIVVQVLDSFPGLFRKGRNTHPTDVGLQHAYTLHARYARRRPGKQKWTKLIPALVRPKEPASLSAPQPSQDSEGEELNAETLRALLDFVSEQARLERESRHYTRSQMWLVIGVLVAAVASLGAAVIQAVGN